jgi:hypothetical protein
MRSALRGLALAFLVMNNANAADLPIPRPNGPTVRAPDDPPYSRAGAFYYCELAMSHPPFPEVPFAQSRSNWLIDCAERFSEYRNASKRAESLICEARAADVLAEARRDNIAGSLPPLKSFLTRCENIFRTEALHLPPLTPAPAESVPHRDARFLSP